jgi:hypothetical protein
VIGISVVANAACPSVLRIGLALLRAAHPHQSFGHIGCTGHQ